MAPPAACPNAPPSSMPEAKIDCAEARRSCGNDPEIMDCAAGAYAASPSPTNERAISSIMKPFANPPANVAALQKRIPNAMMALRLKRSAKNPDGMLAKASTMKSELCSQPSCPSEILNCARRIGTRDGITWRAAKLTKLIKASTASSRN